MEITRNEGRTQWRHERNKRGKEEKDNAIKEKRRKKGNK